MTIIRSVLQFRFDQWLSMAEIARASRISQGPVHNLLLRARVAGLDRWALPEGLDDAAPRRAESAGPGTEPEAEAPESEAHLPGPVRDLRYSRSFWASSNIAVLVPGAALRTARVRCEGSSAEHAAEAAGARYAVPPAATAGANMRRPRSSARPHTLHRWTRSDSALGIGVPQREQSCNVPAGGTSTKGFRRSHPFAAECRGTPPTLLGDGPVQATLVLALAVACRGSAAPLPQ